MCLFKVSTKRVLIVFFIVVLFFVIKLEARVPSASSKVYVKKRQLVVEKRLKNGLLNKPKPYIIKGTTWSPATRAPHKGPHPFNPSKSVPYGFFFDWKDRDPQGHKVLGYWLRSQFKKYYLVDILLMKKMNINTVRVYDSLGNNPQEWKKILDEFYRNNIMVILTVAASKDDIDSKKYIKLVKHCKDHPAILMWSLGNEWNLDYNKYWGYKTISEAARATEKAARRIRHLDKDHPVSSCLGDRFIDRKPANTIAWVVRNCPSVQIWGINVYRGKSFHNLFDVWQNTSYKPFYISEFGTDSFYTSKFKVVNRFQADNCEGKVDDRRRGKFLLELWSEIENNLSALNPAKVCVGGLVHEFNDSLWKVGSYHLSLGGLVNYNDPREARSYATYNSEGFYLKGSHPDNVSNEEFYGVVDAKRRPKEVYWVLRKYYKKLEQLGE
ncbi:MAG: hypothetical protein JSW17_02775 [Candidatus Omnitrophota bacterium]|nr:MAG: hypothetical protein JSW17_02775 [Candidatus Omnitrophota bacterium]